MSIAFWDGFDHYTTTADEFIWDISVGSGIAYSAGRFGGQRAGQTSNGNAGSVRTLPNVTTAFCVSLAFIHTNGAPTGTAGIIAVLDGASLQLELRMNSSRQLVVTRNTTTLATSTAVLAANVWYWISFKGVINNATGSFDVEVDGVQVLTGTGADTQNTANASCSRLQLIPGGNNLSSGFIDDLVFQDDQGGTPGHLAERKVITGWANAVGNSSQWTRSTGADQWATVDEMPPNSDTDYNSDATPGNKDTLNFPTFSILGAVDGVQVNLFARKDDVGVREICAVTRSAGTDFQGPTHTMATSYNFYQSRRLVDPATSAAWSAAAVDAAEFGYETIT